MKHRIIATVVAVGMTSIVHTWAINSDASAQSSPTSATKSWTHPRTAWGDPDLQGKWLLQETATPFERPAEFGNRELLTDKELAEKMAQVAARRRPAEETNAPRPAGSGTGTYNRFWLDELEVLPWNRTSLVIDPPDGRVPPLTPEAVKRVEAREIARRGRGEADGWEDRNVSERCLLTSYIRFEPSEAAALSLKEIIQTPGYVVVMVHTLNSYEPIVIPVDGRSRPGDAVRTWLGISRGRWDGNTLVVETTHINDKQEGGPVMASRMAFGIPGTRGINGVWGSGETLRIVERFTRVSPDMIEYRYTVDDPKTYVKPFTVLRPLTKEPDDFFMPENGCHEGNYGIVGQLSGGRADEAYSLKFAADEAEARKPRLEELKRRSEEWVKSGKR